MNYTIKFDPALDEVTLELLESNLLFLSHLIINFSLKEDKIELNFKENIDIEDFQIKLFEMIKKLKPVKVIPAKVIFEQRTLIVKEIEDVFEKLIESEQAYILSDGIVALTGLPLHMMEVYDQKILEFAKNQNAKKILLPITVSFNNLHESNYFSKTPQHANFLSTISENTRTITDFATKFFKTKAIDVELLNSPHGMCRSAACLNSYPLFKNKTFKKNERIVLTTEGRVFRHEYKKVNTLERLYEFSCREIIYLGDKAFVESMIKECENWNIDFLKKLGINCVIKTATDPFFVENAKSLQFYQAAENSKFEIRALNPFSNVDVSIGSLNLHGIHFGKSYNIKLESGEYVSSGCVGFGLERTIFSILSQFGIEYQNWPKELQDFFKVDCI